MSAQEGTQTSTRCRILARGSRSTMVDVTHQLFSVKSANQKTSAFPIQLTPSSADQQFTKHNITLTVELDSLARDMPEDAENLDRQLAFLVTAPAYGCVWNRNEIIGEKKMCYDEYLSAGGTRESLLDYIEHYFLDNQDFPIEERTLICESNRERNELLHVISDSNRLELGFEIDNFSDMSSWRTIYYTEPGKVHTGLSIKCIDDDAACEYMDRVYDLLLQDIKEQYEPLDIMQLFSDVCFSAAC